MNSTQPGDAVVTVEVGHDIVLAQSLSARLIEEGIEIELILSSDPYIGLDHASPHRLMIRERDVEAARPIIEAQMDDDRIGAPARTDGDESGHGFGTVLVLIGAVLLAAFVLPALVFLGLMIVELVATAAPS